MILDDAPPLMMFSTDVSLSESEAVELDTLENKKEKTPEDIARIDELKTKAKNAPFNFNYIPIPIDPNLTQFQVSDIRASTKKRVIMVGDEPVTRNTLNTTTIGLLTVDSDMVDLMVNAATLLFNIDDSLPRFKFFSKQCLILGGRLIGFDSAVTDNDNKVLVTLTIQRGSSDEEMLRKLFDKTEEPAYSIDIPWGS